MKRYLVTGASRGIGRAIATRLATPEVNLLLHGRDRAALAETARLCRAQGAEVGELIYDFGNAEGVHGLIEAVGTEPLELLVNNAGITIVKPYPEITTAEWNRSLAVNLTAPFLLMQYFAPRMPTGANIVNVLSVAARTAFPNWSAYCATKFALEGLSSAIREELRVRRVRVLNVYPSATDTEIWNSVAGDWPRERMMSAADVASAVAYAISQPAKVGIENITLSNVAGAL